MTKFNDLERQNKENPDPSKASQLAKLRMDLCSLLQGNHDHMLRQLKLKYYTSHNRVGKFLASRLKARRLKAKIPFLYHPHTKQKVSNPKQIANAFVDYNESLYNLKDDPSTPQPTGDLISSFLGKLNLPSVTTSEHEDLNCPFSRTEILKTIQSMPCGKSLGPDGFPGEYYQAFSSKLVAHLQTMFTATATRASFPPPRCSW